MCNNISSILVHLAKQMLNFYTLNMKKNQFKSKLCIYLYIIAKSESIWKYESVYVLFVCWSVSIKDRITKCTFNDVSGLYMLTDWVKMKPVNFYSFFMTRLYLAWLYMDAHIHTLISNCQFIWKVKAHDITNPSMISNASHRLFKLISTLLM